MNEDLASRIRSHQGIRVEGHCKCFFCDAEIDWEKTSLASLRCKNGHSWHVCGVHQTRIEDEGGFEHPGPYFTTCVCVPGKTWVLRQIVTKEA